MPDTLTVERLLRVALKNELEATEIAAVWISTTSELDVKLAFARQAGDEARHYRLISERLADIGVDASKIDPREDGYSALFEYLQQLQSTVARVAAAQFTREGIALVRNQRFIEFCDSRGDHETAAPVPQPHSADEPHNQSGPLVLARLRTDEDTQQLARDAARRTLELPRDSGDGAPQSRDKPRSRR